jgi:hypothetical protein
VLGSRYLAVIRRARADSEAADRPRAGPAGLSPGRGRAYPWHGDRGRGRDRGSRGRIRVAWLRPRAPGAGMARGRRSRPASI